jgi:hypothetical protein
LLFGKGWLTFGLEGRVTSRNYFLEIILVERISLSRTLSSSRKFQQENFHCLQHFSNIYLTKTFHSTTQISIMAPRSRSTVSWLCLVLLVLGLISPTYTYPHPSSLATTDIVPGSTHIVAHPDKIEPPAPKFKTTADPDLPPELDLNVLAETNLSSWDDDNLILTTTMFMPGQYQTRLPAGNGYVEPFSYVLVLWNLSEFSVLWRGSCCLFGSGR